MLLQDIQSEIIRCTACPRLREHCRSIAAVKRRAYRDEEYWGQPVPSFGDPDARLLIVGLAPGAHGANRTGRMFTGDRSGDFLYRALYEAGFANQAGSVHRDDGLVLRDAYIAAPVHCAPPDNKPLPEEIGRCRIYLEREIALLRQVQAVVVLGRIAHETWLSIRGLRRAEYPFAHGAVYEQAAPKLLCSFHPSQQNTQTGRLTREMLANVFFKAREIISCGRPYPSCV